MLKIARKIPKPARYVSEGVFYYLLDRIEGISKKEDIKRSVIPVLYFLDNLVSIFSVVEQVARDGLDNSGKKELVKQAKEIVKRIDRLEEYCFPSSTRIARNVYQYTKH